VRHIPYAALSDVTAAHTVTVLAASKAWNLPGLKCAQVVTSNSTDRATWRAIPLWETIGVSTMGMEASTAAYLHGDTWLGEVMTQLDANRRMLSDRVATWPGVRLGSLEATYLAWLDLTDLHLEEEPATWLLREARVALSGGAPFRAAPHRFARVNYATTPPILGAALDRIEVAISRVSAP
jgi:cystathionine beta-lyase